jgi:transposase
MIEQIEALTERIERLDQDILACVKDDEVARRLTSIPGVGPLIAARFGWWFKIPRAFRSGRDFAAWIGLTPRVQCADHMGAAREGWGL